MMRHLLEANSIRFGLVSLAGLTVDVGVAWALASISGVPLVFAVVVGFVAGATVNYFLHEFWTFKAMTSKVSAFRGASYLAVVMLTLAARLAIIALIDSSGLVATLHKLPTLLIATGFSFFVNYVLSKYFVFKRVSDSTSRFSR